MKRLILVNGVPASGKSTVAAAMAQAGRWPLIALDTIKEALFAHLGTGDRDYNRMLGRASYQAMFNLAADFPGGMTIVMDAWFGFQPESVLAAHLAGAGSPGAVQVWCHAPAAEIGRRYAARIGERSGGHLGADRAGSGCLNSFPRKISGILPGLVRCGLPCVGCDAGRA